MEFLGLWLLCGFACAVFAVTSIRGWWSLACAVTGFVLAVLAVSASSPVDPVATGVLGALVAVTGLAWPRHWIVTSAAAGAMAGFWAALFESRGTPASVALATAAAMPVLSAWLAQVRPSFAPQIIRDEALLLIFLLGSLVAVGPGVQAGWRAALNLSINSSAAAAAVPVWTLAISAASVLLGGMYTLWSRR